MTTSEWVDLLEQTEFPDDPIERLNAIIELGEANEISDTDVLIAVQIECEMIMAHRAMPKKYLGGTGG